LVTKLSDTVIDSFTENQFRYIPELTAFPTIVISGGNFVKQDGTIGIVAQRSLTVVNNATSIVYISFAAAPSIALRQSGSEPTTNVVRLYEVVASAGVITSITDRRVRSAAVV
jgi:hypothetical protein